ncbi:MULTISPECIES: hypothetical protein [Sphingobacterium]|uniref:Uncharacterized protein n=1 Tax=Sphingobacterium athyrii TaxID=2152717 RepID=A0A363P0L3_9SPHI|nr:hypothetical protein DCO56_01045 [Sphingobacterium athyrii]
MSCVWNKYRSKFVCIV